MIYPIIMQGVTALLSANQIGSPLDFRSLQNRTNKILRVEEIRFHPTAENGQAVGSQIRTCGIQLRIGNEPITSSFAPLPAMTWPIGDYATEGSLDLTNDVLSGFYLRFSKPVLLAPGQAIALRVRHESATAMILRTTVLCREANQKDQGYTPWISHFSTPRRV
ncbi:MAG TPA: hypothetical protein VLV48_09810, partial [Thermoanaerobaculia bacterium]|nr:hypothetical protein [Thermoanaerobaculia bacterium]